MPCTLNRSLIVSTNTYWAVVSQAQTDQLMKNCCCEIPPAELACLQYLPIGHLSSHVFLPETLPNKTLLQLTKLHTARCVKWEVPELVSVVERYRVPNLPLCGDTVLECEITFLCAIRVVHRPQHEEIHRMYYGKQKWIHRKCCQSPWHIRLGLLLLKADG